MTGANGSDGATEPTGLKGLQEQLVLRATGVNGQGGLTTAGAGISISGAGTTADPYVVNANFLHQMWVMGFGSGEECDEAL